MPPPSVVDGWKDRVGVDHPRAPKEYQVYNTFKYNVQLDHIWASLGIMNFQSIFKDSAFCWQFVVACGLVRGPFIQFPCPAGGCPGIIKGGWDTSKSEKFPWHHLCTPPVDPLPALVNRKQHVCGSKTTPATNTWFYRSKLTIYQSLLLPFLHLEKIPVVQASRLAVVGREAAVYMYAQTRHIAAVVMTNAFATGGIADRQIGGPGRRIQIDESHIFKAKYNKGAPSTFESQHIWVLGIWEEGSPNKGLLFPVKKRDRKTLWPIIGRYVHKESIIITDGWAAYAGLGAYFRQHHVVNHTEGFINPATGSNTNTQEGRWNGVKPVIKSCRSVKHLEGYLHVYMYIEYFLRPIATAAGVPLPGLRFKRWLEDVVRVHPGFGREGIGMREWPQLRGCYGRVGLIPKFSYEPVTEEMLEKLVLEGRYYPHVLVTVENPLYTNILTLDFGRGGEGGGDEDEDEGEDFDPSYVRGPNFGK
jgi:hypothetical protein